VRKLALASAILLLLVAAAFFTIHQFNTFAEFQVAPGTYVRLYYPNDWEGLAPVLCEFVENGNVSVVTRVEHVDPDDVYSWDDVGFTRLASPDGRLIGIIRGPQDPSMLSFGDLGRSLLVVADLDQRIAVAAGAKNRGPVAFGNRSAALW
jgi:hypothetical protein